MSRCGNDIPVELNVVQSSFAAPVAWFTLTAPPLTESVTFGTPSRSSAAPATSTPVQFFAPCVIETNLTLVTEPVRPVAPVVSIAPSTRVPPLPTKAAASVIVTAIA